VRRNPNLTMKTLVGVTLAVGSLWLGTGVAVAAPPDPTTTPDLPGCRGNIIATVTLFFGTGVGHEHGPETPAIVAGVQEFWC
jgi:hypothetical protein